MDDRFVRFLVSGRRINDKREIIGFLMPDLSGRSFVIYPDGIFSPERFEVDPDTILPVGRTVIMDPIYDNGEGATIVSYTALCPDCENVMDWEKEHEFCHLCGQRLSWPEGE